MKIANKKIRKRDVKRALLFSVYAVSALAMIIWTVAPAFK